MSEREHLTTFQAAALAGVTAQTVCNWVDAGKVAARRTPGGHRRILRRDFVEFLDAQHPSRGDLPAPRVILSSGTADEVIACLLNVGFEVRVVNTMLALGIELMDFAPVAVVLDPNLPAVCSAKVLADLRADPRTERVQVLVTRPLPNMEPRSFSLESRVPDVLELIHELRPLLPEVCLCS